MIFCALKRFCLFEPSTLTSCMLTSKAYLTKHNPKLCKGDDNFRRGVHQGLHTVSGRSLPPKVRLNVDMVWIYMIWYVFQASMIFILVRMQTWMVGGARTVFYAYGNCTWKSRYRAGRMFRYMLCHVLPLLLSIAIRQFWSFHFSSDYYYCSLINIYLMKIKVPVCQIIKI